MRIILVVFVFNISDKLNFINLQNNFNAFFLFFQNIKLIIFFGVAKFIYKYLFIFIIHSFNETRI